MGPTGPTGAEGPVPGDVFAFFATYAAPFPNSSLIPLAAVTADPTGQITLAGPGRVVLEPGVYHLSYHVSVLLRAPGYMQVTPYYSGASHIEFGVYFKTAGSSASACGSNAIILTVPARTQFTLTYNGSETGLDGAAALTVVQLRRSP